MVDVLTPLHKLDDAVHEFLRETEQFADGAFVTDLSEPID